MSSAIRDDIRIMNDGIPDDPLSRADLLSRPKKNQPRTLFPEAGGCILITGLDGGALCQYKVPSRATPVSYRSVMT